jgi:N-methylhydantoinase B/oxoprolinase/acetone carboxylase alpha subunit
MAGGSAGQPGINRVERADGRIEALDHTGSVEMAPGDVFVIETPGGGGYGERQAFRLSGAFAQARSMGCGDCRISTLCR